MHFEQCIEQSPLDRCLSRQHMQQINSSCSKLSFYWICFSKEEQMIYENIVFFIYKNFNRRRKLTSERANEGWNYSFRLSITRNFWNGLIVLSNRVVACARGSKLLARRRGEWFVVVVKHVFSFDWFDDGEDKNGFRTNVLDDIGVSRCSL